MSFDLIRATLDARLLTLPDWPSARIAWPNLPYRPLGEETYLQVAIAASEPRQADLGSAGRNIQRGLYGLRRGACRDRPRRLAADRRPTLRDLPARPRLARDRLRGDNPPCLGSAPRSP